MNSLVYYFINCHGDDQAGGFSFNAGMPKGEEEEGRKGGSG